MFRASYVDIKAIIEVVKVKKIVLLILSFSVLSGCATFHPTIPEGYSGPVATIQDSEKRIDVGKADLFYLSHIDGRSIRNSRSASMSASYGQGNRLSTVLINNSVPVGSHSFTVVGRTVYAMPARALASTVYEVKGDIEFSPEQDASYIIKGVLAEEGSSVWIANSSTGEVVKKIEVQGPSKLGLFKK
jgi:hypothetical protein